MNGITLIPCYGCGRGYPSKDMIWYIDEEGKERPFCVSCWKGVKE